MTTAGESSGSGGFRPDDPGRHETATEQLDRNWASLLQELRVVQTGVQILTGLMLTIPFQQRFTELSDDEQHLYLASLICAVGATVALIAPVALHRLLFRRHRLSRLVSTAHVLTLVGLALLALAVTGVVALIFDVVVGSAAGVVAAICAVVVFTVMWLGLPLFERFRGGGSPG